LIVKISRFILSEVYKKLIVKIMILPWGCKNHFASEGYKWGVYTCEAKFLVLPLKNPKKISKKDFKLIRNLKLTM